MIGIQRRAPFPDSARVNGQQFASCLLGKPCIFQQGAEVGGGVARLGEINHGCRHPVRRT